MASKKKNRLPPFVYITQLMLRSDAYKELSNASRTAYLLLRAQLKKPEQIEVIFPYSHAQEYMQKRTFAGAIRQLIKMGFIEKKQSGGLYKRTNIYSFIHEWEPYRKPKRDGIYIEGVCKSTPSKKEKRVKQVCKSTPSEFENTD